MSDILKNLSDAMAGAVEATSPVIVSVNGRRRLPATGIIHSADGVIVTAHHTLERDENIHITLHDGSTHEATLIGRDPHNDLAVLRVQASDLPAVTWGNNDTLKVGNLVLAMGRPGEQVQATLGVVSALVSGEERRPRPERAEGKGKRRRRRGRQMGRALADGYIQTDVVMYPGFSGGPLVSGDGAVHGINTSGFGRGASVAVPTTTIANTIETLLAHGRMRQGYLGVGVQAARLPEAIAGELEQETGLLVVSVEAQSPAHTAGILVGDIIVALDDNNVEQLDELLALLQGERVGKDVTVQLVRGGNLHDLSVTIAERM